MVYLIPIALLLLLLWLVVARPQRRRQMSQLQMQDTLELGDEVITAGGIHGTVRRVGGENGAGHQGCARQRCPNHPRAVGDNELLQGYTATPSWAS